jgi:hypothetical protein
VQQSYYWLLNSMGQEDGRPRVRGRSERQTQSDRGRGLDGLLKFDYCFRQRQSALALLQASTQSYDAALESYSNGVRNLLDVTAAQRTLAQARSADVSARTQVLTSLADLAFTTGDSIRTITGGPGHECES